MAAQSPYTFGPGGGLDMWGNPIPQPPMHNDPVASTSEGVSMGTGYNRYADNPAGAGSPGNTGTYNRYDGNPYGAGSPGSVPAGGAPVPGGGGEANYGWNPPQNPQSPWYNIPTIPPPGYSMSPGGRFNGVSTTTPNISPADYGSVQQYSDQAYDAAMRYIDPQQRQQDRRFEQMLINRGIDPNSQAGQEAMMRLRRGQNDQLNAASFGALQFGQGIQDQMWRQAYGESQLAANMQQALWQNELGYAGLDNQRYGMDLNYNLGRGELDLNRQIQDFREMMGLEGLSLTEQQLNDDRQRWETQLIMSLLGYGGQPGTTGSINPYAMSQPPGWGEWWNNIYGSPAANPANPGVPA